MITLDESDYRCIMSYIKHMRVAMLKYFALYFIIINIIAYLVMWRDKRHAIKNQWRTPEKTLFTFALLGGFLGIYSAMNTFRHKTKKWYFKYGIPIIGIVYLILAGYIILRGSTWNIN